MRKKNREVTEFNELLEIISKCDVCRIAFFDEEYPYIVPMNFGYEAQDNELVLYFHCAREGRKLELAALNNKAAFEMDCSHKLVTGNTDCACTMEYESICGNGEIIILPDSEKVHALTQLMKHYVQKPSYDFEDKDMKFATVFKLKVNEIYGKRLKKS